MSGAHEGNVLATYRSLRLAMVPLLLVLVVASLLETMRGQVCVLGSISAYFHTPVRGAFVFALAGLGACLIAYKGNDSVEDVLLNFAGFMAFLVALVPTAVDTTCAAKYGDVVPDANSAEAVRNNVLTLVVVSVVACGLYFLMPRVVAATQKREGLLAVLPAPGMPSDEAGRTSPLARILAAVAGLVVLIQLALFGFWPGTFLAVAHWISAVTMVLGVLGVMMANARGLARATEDGPSTRLWVNRYVVVAAATLALGLVTLLLLHSSPHLVLVIELIVIGGFVVFWFLQTRELWDYPSRDEKSQQVDRVLEAMRRGGDRGPVDLGAETAASRPVSMVGPARTLPPTVAAPAGRMLSRRDVFNAL